MPTAQVVSETAIRGPRKYLDIQKVTLSWTCTDAGVVTQTTTQALDGRIVRVEVIPGTTTAQPTDAFDMTLTNPAGYDQLYGQGADLSNVNTTVIVNVGYAASEKLTLNISNAGNAKSGVTVLYLAQEQ